MNKSVVLKEEVFYKFSTVLKILDISESTGRRWKKAGLFPQPVVINDMERYSSFDVEKFVDKQNPSRNFIDKDLQAFEQLKGK